MDNALYQFQQSVGRANDEKINKENDAKDKLQALQDKFAERVKSPLDALGGSLTEDGAHDLLKKAGKYGLKKLGASDETVENIGRVLNKVNPKQLITKPKQAVLDALKGKGKAPIKSTEDMGDEMDNFASKVKGKIKVKGKKKIKPQDDDDAGGGPADAGAGAGDSSVSSGVDSLVPLDDAEASAVDISKVATGLSRTQEAARTLTTAPKNLLGGLRGDSTIQRTLGIDKELNPNTVTSSIKSEAQDGLNLARTAAANTSEKLGAGAADDAASAAVKAAAAAAKAEAEAAAKAAAKSSAKALAKKAGTRMAEDDALGGGPEDPFGDVISLIIGGATLLGGIFSHKKKQASPSINVANPTYQAGAT